MTASHRPTRSSEAEIAGELTKLTGWALEGESGKLHRVYQFADFVTAFAFMSGAALVAERLNHHPEWENVWSTVRVRLTTHDAGGITALDFKLAHEMERLAARLLA